jgi:hypothetical protein
MNMDSGLFHLSMAVRSIRNGNSLAQAQESPSAVEPKLSDIDHLLLSRTRLRPDRPAIRVNRCCQVAGAGPAHERLGRIRPGPPYKKQIFVSERPRVTFLRRFAENAGWLVPGTILALLPKCPACVATYAVIGTGVGFSLSGMTYLRTLLVILWLASLLYLAARRMRPFMAMIFKTQERESSEEATQVLGATSCSLYNRVEQTVDRTLNRYKKQI